MNKDINSDTTPRKFGVPDPRNMIYHVITGTGLKFTVPDALRQLMEKKPSHVYRHQEGSDKND